MQAVRSPFAAVEAAPPDPILGLTEAFLADENPRKVNLGVGVYQDDTGRVPVLATVREAEERWHAREDSKSYLPIDGPPAYNRAVQELLFGSDSAPAADGRAVTVTALGGTGALKVGADFLRRFLPDSAVWISTPSWENHRALFEAAGFTVNTYPYYDPATRALDFGAMAATLRELPAGSIVALHACCHNPTGVDLTPGQWQEVVALFRRVGLVPFLDFAYQGFAQDIQADAFAVRAFAESGVPCLIASSFSKSFSLYRERVGALTIVTSHAEEARRVLSQVKRVIRTNYSNPPSHGAQVVALVLGDPELRVRWEAEVAAMRERIRRMRQELVEGLRARGLGQDFGFIARQRGMFSFSGLPLEAVRRLRADYSLYIVDSGRICVAALNERNLPYVCDAIAAVLAS